MPTHFSDVIMGTIPPPQHFTLKYALALQIYLWSFCDTLLQQAMVSFAQLDLFLSAILCSLLALVILFPLSPSVPSFLSSPRGSYQYLTNNKFATNLPGAIFRSLLGTFITLKSA